MFLSDKFSLPTVATIKSSPSNNWCIKPVIVVGNLRLLDKYKQLHITEHTRDFWLQDDHNPSRECAMLY